MKQAYGKVLADAFKRPTWSQQDLLLEKSVDTKGEDKIPELNMEMTFNDMLVASLHSKLE